MVNLLNLIKSRDRIAKLFIRYGEIYGQGGSIVTRTRVKSYRHRIGKNHYLVIQIFQLADARADSGNALASNALNIKISKQRKGRR